MRVRIVHEPPWGYNLEFNLSSVDWNWQRVVGKCGFTKWGAYFEAWKLRRRIRAGTYPDKNKGVIAEWHLKKETD